MTQQKGIQPLQNLPSSQKHPKGQSRICTECVLSVLV